MGKIIIKDLITILNKKGKIMNSMSYYVLLEIYKCTEKRLLGRRWHHNSTNKRLIKRKLCRNKRDKVLDVSIEVYREDQVEMFTK